MRKIVFIFLLIWFGYQDLYGQTNNRMPMDVQFSSLESCMHRRKVMGKDGTMHWACDDYYAGYPLSYRKMVKQYYDSLFTHSNDSLRTLRTLIIKDINNKYIQTAIDLLVVDSMYCEKLLRQIKWVEENNY